MLAFVATGPAENALRGKTALINGGRQIDCGKNFARKRSGMAGVDALAAESAATVAKRQYREPSIPAPKQAVGTGRQTIAAAVALTDEQFLPYRPGRPDRRSVGTRSGPQKEAPGRVELWLNARHRQNARGLSLSSQRIPRNGQLQVDHGQARQRLADSQVRFSRITGTDIGQWTLETGGFPLCQVPSHLVQQCESGRFGKIPVRRHIGFAQTPQPSQQPGARRQWGGRSRDHQRRSQQPCHHG